MKGKLILCPITEWKEEMKVIFYKQIRIFESLEKNTSFGQFASMKGWPNSASIEELKQIAVEYEEYEIDRHTTGYGTDSLGNRVYNESKTKKVVNIKTLPLHPDDWNYAIKHIGEEIEFGTLHHYHNTQTVVMIIPSKPIIYTEEEMLDFAAKYAEHHDTTNSEYGTRCGYDSYEKNAKQYLKLFYKKK